MCLQFHHSAGGWKKIIWLFQQVTPCTEDTVFEILIDVNTFSVAFVFQLFGFVELCPDDDCVLVVKVPLVVGVVLQDFHAFGDALMNLLQAKMN
jgi:hypothetical protein